MNNYYVVCSDHPLKTLRGLEVSAKNEYEAGDKMIARLHELGCTGHVNMMIFPNRPMMDFMVNLDDFLVER